MALSASVATWLFWERAPDAGQGQSSDGCRCDVGQLADGERDSGATAEGSEHEIGQASAGSGDPIRDMFDASSRAALLLRDVAAYAEDAIVVQIWPWPIDSGASEALQHLDASPAELVADVVRDAGALHAAAFEQIPGVSLAGDATRGVVHGVADFFEWPLAAARAAAAALIEGFLASEHRAALGGRDPLLVALFLVVLAVVVAWEIYGCCRLVGCVLRLLGAGAACLVNRTRGDGRGRPADAQPTTKGVFSAHKRRKAEEAGRARGGRALKISNEVVRSAQKSSGGGA
eukprot:CAMPEP_0117496736 /NCGR_PEP_ID=MMETSP0784-20121206/20813_1 /TAXON_ID=39447 /ORGANISM="" /LENGTH=288 /DNA_ID=CAMNT_0005291721 /DNA_START=20 /DNA_END=885 /DNA_ORIENTATION=-